jgi:type III pantothenate kinase
MLELVSFDFIDERKILRRNRPGLQLRYKSLHDFTAKLPLLSLESPKGVVGTQPENQFILEL